MDLAKADRTAERAIPAQGIQADNVERLFLVQATLLTDHMGGASGREVSDGCHLIKFIQLKLYINIRAAYNHSVRKKCQELRVNGSLQLELLLSIFPS